MGSFGGHALPGSFFLMFAVWWTIQITRRYVVCKVKGIPYYNTISYTCFCCCMKFPMEGIVKLVVTSIGMVAEGVSSARPWMSGNTGRMNDYNGFWIGDIQHVSMYLMFFISGVFDILAIRKCRLVPIGMDYMTAALAYTSEGLLFLFHLHGKDALEVTLHTLLIYSIAGGCIACLVEYKFHNSVFVAFTRTFFVFLQGTWFWQAGFILYPPFPSLNHWSGTDHENVMLATAIFTWHFIGILSCMSLISGATYFLSTKVCPIRKGSTEYTLTGINIAATAEAEANRTLTEIQILSSSEDEETSYIRPNTI